MRFRHDDEDLSYDSDPGLHVEAAPRAPLDKSTTRKHSLSLPPPVWDDRLAPRQGCMSCVVQPNGVECAYRASYGCGGKAREWGLEEGLCVLELAARRREGAAWWPLVNYLTEKDRPRFRHLIERWLDATVYAIRAATWSSIVWASSAGDESPFAPGSAIRKSARYVFAGNDRRRRIGRELFPLRVKAEKAKRIAERLAKRREEKEAAARAG